MLELHGHKQLQDIHDDEENHLNLKQDSSSSLLLTFKGSKYTISWEKILPNDT